MLFMLLLWTGMPATFVSAQTLDVEGVVSDEAGEPCIGASVLVKGTQTRVATDIDGKFHLSGLSSANVLVISYIGMETQEVNVRPKMNVTLISNLKELEEVMVVAFGEQKRASFTGSAAIISTEQLEQRQATNVIDALKGQVAGMQISSGSGAPESTPELRVRGFSSLKAGNAPLIVLDGVPYDGGWNDINPSDVESVTVLKDASSNALYGARGANGIIMITTKKTKAGNATVTLDAKWGANSNAARQYDIVNDPGQYYEMQYRALYNYYTRKQGYTNYQAHKTANETLGDSHTNGGLGYMIYTVPQGEYLIGENGRLNPNASLGNRVYSNGQVYTICPDDWVDEAYRTALRQEYNVNVNGGSNDLQYYASVGYLSNEGIVIGSDYERYTARFKANYQAKRWLRTGGNVGYTHATSNSVADDYNGLFYVLNNMAPIYPLYLRDGNGNILTDTHGALMDYGDGMNGGLNRPFLSLNNPIKDNELNTENRINNTFTLQGFADIMPLNGLKITVNGNVMHSSERYTSSSQPYYGYGAQMPSSIYKQDNNVLSYNLQQLINYSRSFGKHNASLLLGHENYVWKSDYLYGQRDYMFSYEDNQELAGAVKVTTTNSYINEYQTEGYFLRALYDYDGKYFGNISYRRDASTRFHPDHRWGNFYSLGAAWIITKEQWMPSLKWMNQLKLKASYGVQGNDAIGDYLYLSTYKIGLSANGDVALSPSDSNNTPDITWEKNGSLNIGLEFELFNSRLTGSMDYFYRKTTDMLSWVYLPLSMSSSGYSSNIGDMVNKGIELTLNGTVLRTRDFRWDLNLNLTHYKNEIVRLSKDDCASSLEGHRGYTNGNYFNGEGLPIYTYRIKKYAGVSDEGLSQWYYTDENGQLKTTTTYSEGDYYNGGTALPDVYGGFGTSLSWKGLDLSIGFVYSIGGKIYDNGYAATMNNPTAGMTGFAFHKDLLNAWSETNPNSNIPRLQYNDLNTNAYSDRFLTDASYLSLQNINLGYVLPAKWSRKFRMSKIRFYAVCDNVYLWSKRRGLDPRTGFTGSSSSTSYSPMRTFSGGVSIHF